MRFPRLAAPLAFLGTLTALVPVASLTGCHTATTTPAPDAGRAVYTGPATATIGDADAKVVLRLDHFGMRVENAAGTALLDSFDGDSSNARVTGDDVHAYGALGATYHDTQFTAVVIEGWDHVIGTDQPWRHATRVASAVLTPTSASLDLFDPADEATTVHLDLAVDGAEVRFAASIPTESPAAEGDAAAGIGALNQMGQSFVLPADEHFFGLGERLVTVDHRGQHYECWVEEGGYGEGEGMAVGPSNPSPNGPGMSHSPIPFMI